MSKSKFKGSTGLPITEGLFLELNYSPDSIYSLKDEDCEYKGKEFPSIKLLYLAEVTSPEDGEYEFANKYFLNWSHWSRICRNKRLKAHIDLWREELEIKLRSQGIKMVIDSALDGSFQAAKWLADAGFSKRKAGRPSKEELNTRHAQDKRIEDEYKEDLHRLQ
jgi:hypothetical protein